MISVLTALEIDIRLRQFLQEGKRCRFERWAAQQLIEIMGDRSVSEGERLAAYLRDRHATLEEDEDGQHLFFVPAGYRSEEVANG